MRCSPILLLSLLLSLTSLSLLDYERALVLRVEEVVQRFHSPVKYRHIGDGVFEFTDILSGQTFLKQVTDVKPLGGKKPKKIITIDVTQIDTTGFGSMFTKIASIPAGVQNIVPVGLHAKDGSVHFLAAKFMNGSYASTDFYKWEAGKDTLDAVQRLTGEWQYPFAETRIFTDNLPNVAVDSFGTIIVYDTQDNENLPARKRAIRYGKNESSQKPRVYDLDGDGTDEIVLRNREEQFPARAIITKYRFSNGIFEDVFSNFFNDKFVWGSWAVSDFDKDNKGEFATATNGGFVFFVENGGNNSTYTITFTDTTRAQNAGFNYEGNDLDNDGRPEAFIGSSFFGGLANIAVYETIGDNNFEVSLWIEIRGVGALKEGIVTGDIDGDGTNELIIHLGGVAIILKSTDKDQYELMWMKSFPNEIGIRCFDVNQDGIDELIISQQRFESLASFTEIFSYAKTVSIKTPVIKPPLSFSIIPNPMTDAGQIVISCPQSDDLELHLYTSGGQFVRSLYNGRLMGTESISLRTQGMIPGIYFIQLRSSSQAITKKLIVLH